MLHVVFVVRHIHIIHYILIFTVKCMFLTIFWGHTVSEISMETSDDDSKDHPPIKK